MAGNLYRDMLFIVVLLFLSILVAVLPYINDPSEEDKSVPPGNVLVMVTWPSGMDTDVDTWLMGPGEISPIGYSNKSGLLWDLLRDDLGKMPDATDLNVEHAYTRGIAPGRYVVNVHAFRSPTYPIPVTVEVSINDGKPGKSIRPIIVAKTVLTTHGQEKTVVSFELDAKGDVVPGSMNSIPRKLRSGAQ